MPAGSRPMALLAGLLVLSATSLVHSRASHLAQAGEKPRPAAPKPVQTATGSGTAGLPAPVLAMREAILEAAQSGRLEEMRTAVELNELPPVIGDGSGGDVVDRLRALSGDADGNELLKALVRILGGGWAAVHTGRDIENNRVYVWPRFAETGIADLSAADAAELARVVPPDALEAMRRAGIYTYWRLGIGADGTWHFLRR